MFILQTRHNWVNQMRFSKWANGSGWSWGIEWMFLARLEGVLNWLEVAVQRSGGDSDMQQNLWESLVIWISGVWVVRRGALNIIHFPLPLCVEHDTISCIHTLYIAALVCWDSFGTCGCTSKVLEAALSLSLSYAQPLAVGWLSLLTSSCSNILGFGVFRTSSGSVVLASCWHELEHKLVMQHTLTRSGTSGMSVQCTVCYYLRIPEGSW